MKLAERRSECAGWSLLVVLLAGLWLSLTVSRNYGGNWSALFGTGENVGAPAGPEFGRTYVFSGSNGYDGQFYRRLAHHPTVPPPAGLDSPRLRTRRILVPVMAYMLALGVQRYVDAAYIAIVLGFVFAGVYWMCQWATLHGRNPAWGVLFSAFPATLVSLDRMTVDIALAALCCAWALYLSGDGDKWKVLAVLGLAPLVRETALLLVGASALGLARSRAYRYAVLSLAALIPAGVWWVIVTLGTPSDPTNWEGYLPFSGIAQAFGNGPQEPPQLPLLPVVVAFHYAALAGVGLAVILAAILWWRNRSDAISIATLLFALLVVQTGRPDVWAHVFSFGRVFSPLLILLSLRALASGNWVLLTPLLLTLPRTLVEFAPQVLGAFGQRAR